MRAYDVVIVGGGPAGFNGAKTVKSLFPEKSLLVINDKSELQIPCSIPYAVAGEVPPEKNRYPLEKVREFGELPPSGTWAQWLQTSTGPCLREGFSSTRQTGRTKAVS